MSLATRLATGIQLVQQPGKLEDTSKKSLEVLLNDLQDELNDRKTKISTLEVDLSHTKQNLKQIELRRKVLDVADETVVTTFLTTTDGTYEEKRKALSDQVRTAIQESHIPGNKKPIIRESTVSEELEYWRNVGTPDDGTIRHGDMKALTIIPDFTGTSEAQWRAFEHPWLMAIRNRHITEADMKSVLFQKLKGSAATLYLSIPGTEQMPFGEIMNRMRKEYTVDPLTAFNRINGMSQKHNELVRDYSARMTTEGSGMLPKVPRELVTLVVGSTAVVIPNPSMAEEQETFPQRYSEGQSRLANAFLRGLRPDIAARLTSEQYTEYDQVVEAAKKAEWMKESVSAGIIHALEVDVNAMNIRNRPGGRFKPKFGHGNRDTPKNDACFRCGGSGHWAAECTQPKKTYPNSEQANFQKSRPTQKFYTPPRGRYSRGRGGFKGTGQPFHTKGRGGPLPWNPRDPRRRKWMVQKRAGLNRKVKYRQRVHNLTGQEIENTFSEGEIDLAELEEELEQDPDEYEQYQLEVEEFQAALENEDDQPKN